MIILAMPMIMLVIIMRINENITSNMYEWGDYYDDYDDGYSDDDDDYNDDDDDYNDDDDDDDSNYDDEDQDDDSDICTDCIIMTINTMVSRGCQLFEYYLLKYNYL